MCHQGTLVQSVHTHCATYCAYLVTSSVIVDDVIDFDICTSHGTYITMLMAKEKNNNRQTDGYSYFWVNTWRALRHIIPQLRHWKTLVPYVISPRNDRSDNRSCKTDSYRGSYCKQTFDPSKTITVFISNHPSWQQLKFVDRCVYNREPRGVFPVRPAAVVSTNKN